MQKWSIGLMSGTSLDGIDAALLKTDGNEILEIGDWLTIPFQETLRHKIREAVYMRGDILATEHELTLAHADAVKELLKKSSFKPKDIEVIGFHGQTIAHRPDQGITWQIGNGALLAEKTGINVVCDFRRRDVAAGGQGAPLVPLFHAAMVKYADLPVAIVNIGGIANITWIGRSENSGNDILALDIMAFDSGVGNVLLNEWIFKHTGKYFDCDGEIAASGTINQAILDAYLQDNFFLQAPPKSLDRNYFDLQRLEGLSLQDGAATLSEFTAITIADAYKHFPSPAKHFYICGGGRHNKTLMNSIRKYIPNAKPVETLGWQGDAIEAQAFAYLAVRSLKKLPLSLPTTTGVRNPVTGGAFYAA